MLTTKSKENLNKGKTNDNYGSCVISTDKKGENCFLLVDKCPCLYVCIFCVTDTLSFTICI